MNGWRAYYVDDTFVSTESDWEQLPATGVLGVIVYFDEPYRKIIAGGDWYYLDGIPKTTDTTWNGYVDPPDLEPPLVKRGAAVSNAEWERVQREMMEARSWP